MPKEYQWNVWTEDVIDLGQSCVLNPVFKDKTPFDKLNQKCTNSKRV